MHGFVCYAYFYGERTCYAVQCGSHQPHTALQILTKMKHKIQFSFVLNTFQVLNSHYVAGGYHVGQCQYCTFPEGSIGKHCLRFDHKLEGSVTPKVFTYCHKNSE